MKKLFKKFNELTTKGVCKIITLTKKEKGSAFVETAVLLGIIVILAYLVVKPFLQNTITDLQQKIQSTIDTSFE